MILQSELQQVYERTNRNLYRMLGTRWYNILALYVNPLSHMHSVEDRQTTG